MGNANRIKRVEPDTLKVKPRCRKRRYETHGEAVKSKLRVLKTSNNQPDRWLQVYFCTTCDGWHVGHGAKRRR